MIDFPIVDAHHHLWDLSGDYPWLQGPRNPDRFTGDDVAIRRDYRIDDYLRDVGTLKLGGSVHVDAGASDSLAEIAFVEAEQTDGVPTVAVASADLLSPDAPALLETLSERPIVRGIRHILNWHADPQYTYVQRDDLMRDRSWLSNFARLAPLGLSFDLQIYPDQMADAAALAAAHPDTQIVLNHTGMPTAGDDDSIAQWRRGMSGLAAHPNTSVKISGLGMTDHRWTLDSLRPFVLGAIDIFGTDRVMFASNFPVDSLYSSYSELYSAFDELTADLGEAARVAVFAHNAERIYRMPAGSGDPAS